MLSEYKLNHILFLDIETVPICRHFNQMPENYQNLFKEKFIKQQGENQSIEDFFEERAGIISEFAKRGFRCRNKSFGNNYLLSFEKGKNRAVDINFYEVDKSGKYCFQRLSVRYR